MRAVSSTFFFVLLFSSAALAERRVVVSCANDAKCAPSGTLIVRGAETRDVPLQRGVAILPDDVELAPGVELRADGFWMASQPLGERLTVWKTSALTGRFEGKELPKTFRLDFTSPPGTRGETIA